MDWSRVELAAPHFIFVMDLLFHLVCDFVFLKLYSPKRLYVVFIYLLGYTVGAQYWRRNWLCCRNGDRYAGEYFGDKMHGFGVYHFANGHCYEGSWHEGRKQGCGMYTFRSGDTRCGEWNGGTLKTPSPYLSDAVLRVVQVFYMDTLSFHIAMDHESFHTLNCRRPEKQQKVPFTCAGWMN